MLIEEIIPKVYKKVLPFKEYDLDKKYKILDYIRKKKINCKVFIDKGYDILSLKFFAIECFLDENDQYKEDIILFDYFDDFYDYVNGDIYKNTCFYGYKFSKEEIDKCNIVIKDINFKSLINFKISDFLKPKKLIHCNHDNDKYKKTLNEIKEFILKCSDIRTLDEYKEKSEQFAKKFKKYYENTTNLFLRLLINNYKDEMKDLFCNIFSHYSPYWDGMDINSLIYLYGADTAIKAANEYDGDRGKNDKKYVYRNRSQFKTRINDFLDGGFKEEINGTYNKKLHIFEIERNLNKDGRTYFTYLEYYLFFDDFIKNLNNDLSNCDLSNFKQEGLDLSNFNINENTKLPIIKNENKNNSNIAVKIAKGFDGDTFYVKIIDNRKNENYEEDSEDEEWKFNYFFDFAYFLNYDISSADLIMCDGIENIKSLDGLNYKGIHVKSGVAIKLGLDFQKLNSNLLEIEEFKETYNNELSTTDNLLNNLHDDYEDTKEIFYVSDIHLIHKILKQKCLSIDDARYVINSIIDDLVKDFNGKNDFFPISLINGDIASDFLIYKEFMSKLRDKLYGFNFVTLGNHELWSFNGYKLNDIISNYRNFLKENGFFLVQNNLYLLNRFEVEEITEEELTRITESDLRKRTKEAYLIIFGGIGFSGLNENFNANNGIYRNTISREEEIEESNKFYKLYKKVESALYDRNVIILTHMPLSSWSKENKYKDGFIYVSGHNHQNYYFDDGKKRIYADNQIGYYTNSVHFKKLYTKYCYDYFCDYKDGIYKINREEYIKFYRGIVNKTITFNSKFDNLYLIKKAGKYMFILEDGNKKYLLKGGSKLNLKNSSIEYYYEKLDIYSENVNIMMKDYESIQKEISKEIKSFGGDGTIHGAIIDIDFYNHVYLNPFDGKLTPYFALSKVEKYVYKDVPSLLKNKCPELYLEYLKLIGKEDENNELVVIKGSNEVSDLENFEPNTTIYEVSNILKTFQYTTQFNVIRSWNDNFLNEVSVENGRLLIESSIYPENFKTYKNLDNDCDCVKTRIYSNDNFSEIYKENIAKETTTIEVLEYINSSTKATYRCKLCGHEWSTRPDHFKSRQHYKCPKCKK